MGLILTVRDLFGNILSAGGPAVHFLALINRLREADSPLVARAKGLIKKHTR